MINFNFLAFMIAIFPDRSINMTLITTFLVGANNPDNKLRWIFYNEFAVALYWTSLVIALGYFPDAIFAEDFVATGCCFNGKLHYLTDKAYQIRFFWAIFFHMLYYCGVIISENFQLFYLFRGFWRIFEELLEHF